MPSLQDVQLFDTKSRNVAHQWIDCQICQGKVTNPVTTVCHHVFCSRCLQRWTLDHTICPTCWDDLNQDRPRQWNTAGQHHAANIVERAPRVPARNEYIGLGNGDEPNNGQPMHLQNSTVTVHNTLIQVMAPQAQAEHPAASPSRVAASRTRGEITIEARRMMQVMRAHVNKVGASSGILAFANYAAAVSKVCGQWEEWLLRRDGFEMFRRDFLNVLEDEMYIVLSDAAFNVFDRSGQVQEDLWNFLQRIARAMCGLQ